MDHLTESQSYSPQGMDHKEHIIEALIVMRHKSIADKEPFKSRAYHKVIDQIKVMSAFTESDISSLKGAGEKITAKIKEIIQTGQLKSAEKAKEHYNFDALEAFSKIYGVGPAKSQELVDKGFYSIEQLRQAVKRDPGLLNTNQKQHPIHIWLDSKMIFYFNT
jgi:DNA polymerase/3'-5' exonuclease PolX